MPWSLASVRTGFTLVRTGTAIITSGTTTTTTTATAGSSLLIGPIALARTSRSADAFAIDCDELTGAPHQLGDWRAFSFWFRLIAPPCLTPAPQSYRPPSSRRPSQRRL